MTDTNELTGRELAVACARAMGWQVLHGMWHRPGEGLPAPMWGFDAYPDPFREECELAARTHNHLLDDLPWKTTKPTDQLPSAIGVPMPERKDGGA